MRNRCHNPRHRQWGDAGGRGITVVPAWDDYARFLADMGRRPTPQHSLDRVDNALGYSPENCRWATRVEQNRNTRGNRLVTIGERTAPLAEWLTEARVSRRHFYYRVSHGMSEAQALLTPSNRKR